jgi:hypothetical protein
MNHSCSAAMSKLFCIVLILDSCKIVGETLVGIAQVYLFLEEPFQ